MRCDVVRLVEAHLPDSERNPGINDDRYDDPRPISFSITVGLCHQGPRFSLSSRGSPALRGSISERAAPMSRSTPSGLPGCPSERNLPASSVATRDGSVLLWPQ